MLDSCKKPLEAGSNDLVYIMNIPGNSMRYCFVFGKLVHTRTS
jgi:hypothetical protein